MIHEHQVFFLWIMCIFHLYFSSQNKNNQFLSFFEYLFLSKSDHFLVICCKLQSQLISELPYFSLSHSHSNVYFCFNSFFNVFQPFWIPSFPKSDHFLLICCIFQSQLISELPYNSLSHSHSNVYFCCHFFFQYIPAVFYYPHLFKIITLQSHFCEFQ